MSAPPPPPAPDTPDDADGESAEAPPLQFPTVDAFVTGFIAPVWASTATTAGTCWCPQWWTHPGAVFRLTALWQAWENMHVNDGPTAAAKWLVSYGDPIMRELIGPAGVFHACSPQKGHTVWPDHNTGVLPCDEPPEGLFTPR